MVAFRERKRRGDTLFLSLCPRLRVHVLGWPRGPWCLWQRVPQPVPCVPSVRELSPSSSGAFGALCNFGRVSVKALPAMEEATRAKGE